MPATDIVGGKDVRDPGRNAVESRDRNVTHAGGIPIPDNGCAVSGMTAGENPDAHIPQRKAAVCTGASQWRAISSSSRLTVSEQPAISSEVT